MLSNLQIHYHFKLGFRHTTQTIYFSVIRENKILNPRTILYRLYILSIYTLIMYTYYIYIQYIHFYTFIVIYMVSEHVNFITLQLTFVLAPCFLIIPMWGVPSIQAYLRNYPLDWFVSTCSVLCYLYYPLFNCLLHAYCPYLSVWVHSDGLAHNLGNIRRWPVLPRSCARPWLYASVFGCVCVWSNCVWVFYLLFSRAIAHRANVICFTCTLCYLILLILQLMLMDSLTV